MPAKKDDSNTTESERYLIEEQQRKLEEREQALNEREAQQERDTSVQPAAAAQPTSSGPQFYVTSPTSKIKNITTGSTTAAGAMFFGDVDPNRAAQLMAAASQFSGNPTFHGVAGEVEELKTGDRYEAPILISATPIHPRAEPKTPPQPK